MTKHQISTLTFRRTI